MFGCITRARHDREMAEKDAEIAQLVYELELSQQAGRKKGRLASELLCERDAARIERDTAQAERDGYRDDALKHRASRANLKQFQPKATNGASVQPSH